MSLQLVNPKQAVQLDRVRIACIKIEYNPYKGQTWVEFWLTIGRLAVPGNEASFQQHIDPDTGEEVFAYLKIENGMNPFRGGTMLGKCGTCGKWFALVSGSCDADGCDGTIGPYDGFTRLMTATASAGTIFDAIANIAYSFLCTEQVPDPDTWEIKRLLEANLG
jgi:hypothetical protein